MADRTNRIQVLGCDVAQDNIVFFDSLSGATRTVDNRPGALRRALAASVPVDEASATLLVCEATGGHEACLLNLAWQAGIPAHRADPRKAHNFFRSLRSEGKSDSIDAQGLARYGLERGDALPLWQPPSPCQQALRGLVRLRADLVGSRADYTRRLKAPGDGPDKAHIQAVVNALGQRIAALDADIDSLVAHDEGLVEHRDLIEAIPGCGRKTATTLIALMPELGRINRRQAAALAGVAPHPNDTGKFNGYRRVRGGRPEIKAALFIAALAASRFHPLLSQHYTRLRDDGKKPIVAIIAVARRLITIINAKIRDAITQRQQLC